MPVINIIPSAGGGGGGILHIFDEKNQSVSPVPPTTLPDPPAQARADLLALLTVSGEEGFESYSVGDKIGTTVSSLTVNGIAATVTAVYTGPGGDEDATAFELAGSIATSTAAGRYNTTPFVGGSKYWNFDPYWVYDAPDTIFVSAVLTFSEPIAAFWLYASDTGDFDATLKIRMMKTGGGYDDYTPDAPAGASNGALNFWGIVDARGTTTYGAVWLRRTNGDDVIGLDGIGFATAAQIAS